MKQICKKVLSFIFVLSLLFLCVGVNVKAEEATYQLTINGYNTEGKTSLEAYQGLFLFKSGNTGSFKWAYKATIKVVDGQYVVNAVAASGAASPSASEYDYILYSSSSDTSGAYNTFSNLGIEVNDIVTFSEDITKLTTGTVSVGVNFSKSSSYSLVINGYNTQAATSLAAYQGLFLFKSGISGSFKFAYKIAIKSENDQYVVSAVAISGADTPSDYDYLLFSSESDTSGAYKILSKLGVEVGDIVVFSSDITSKSKGTISTGVKFYKPDSLSYKDLLDKQTKGSLAVNYTTEAETVTISDNGLALRFGIVMEEALYNSVINDNYKFGIEFYKTSDDTFSQANVTKYITCTPVKSDENGNYDENGKYFTFALVITGMPVDSKAQKIGAAVCVYQGIIMNKDTVVGHAKGCVWSIESIAEEYISKDLAPSHTQVLNLLKGNE